MTQAIEECIDQWLTFEQVIPLGIIKIGCQEGGVAGVTQLHELEEGIEGLVHVSEISKEKIKTPMEKFKIGDVITARVMNINSDERRIGLSIKRMEIEDEQNLLSEYVNNMGPATSSFGEILRENLQEKLNED